MAKFSSRVQNALGVTKHLIGSFVHIELAVTAANVRYPDFEVASALVYWGNVQRTLSNMYARLNAAEDAYTDEQSDDTEILIKRDTDFALAAEVESECYRLFKAQSNPAHLITYGFSGARPKTPSDVAARLASSAKLLTKRPLKLRNGFGPDIESATIVTRILEATTALDLSLSLAETERRELRAALIARDEVLALWNDAYQGIASQAEGLFRMATYKRLADAVRPTTRRARGLDEADTLTPIPSDPTDPINSTDPSDPTEATADEP